MAGREANPSERRRPTAGEISRAMGAVANRARESEPGKNPKPMAVASGGLATRPVPSIRPAAPTLPRPKVVSRYGYA
jgi:hypothetical protein